MSSEAEVSCAREATRVWERAPLLARGLAGAVVAASLLAWSSAQARTAPESFADLAEKLAPAVVNIATFQEVSPSSGEEWSAPSPHLPPGSPFEDFFEFFERRGTGDEDSLPSESHRMISLGSGFVVDPAGYVVTNHHVIEAADQISVVFADETRLDARVIGRDPKTDLALLKVDFDEPLPYVSFGDSEAVRVGDWIIAIGNPFGLGNTVTVGIISARGRDINAGPYDDFLQTDAPINRGNSGGPMFNLEGEVIGVNTLIFSPTGGSVGIGFATPSSLARPVVEQLLHYGRTRRGWLGVRIQTVSAEIAEKLGLSEPRGALVASVTDGGPAEGGHIRAGDVILAFDGQEVATRRVLPRIVADTEVGKVVEVRLWRDGREVTVKVEIGELEEAEQFAAVSPARQDDLEILGLALAEITPELRDRYELDERVSGVVVTQVLNVQVEDGDIEPGDVIVAVAQHEVATPADVAATVEELEREGAKSVLVLRDRGGSRRFVALSLGSG